jgi:nitrogen regulatory protein P-II 1
VKTKLELLVPDALVDAVLGAIQHAANTGHQGDGRIAVIPIDYTVNIRTGERRELA